MQRVILILLGLAILYALARSSGQRKPSRFQHLKGWQKLFGVGAFLLTLLIILNPEFLALGLLGDTAFFDMLVLALSLQMHGLVARAFRRGVDLLSRAARWLGIPSPGLSYLLAIVTPVVLGAVATVQKAVHRLLS